MIFAGFPLVPSLHPMSQHLQGGCLDAPLSLRPSSLAFMRCSSLLWPAPAGRPAITRFSVRQSQRHDRRPQRLDVRQRQQRSVHVRAATTSRSTARISTRRRSASTSRSRSRRARARSAGSTSRRRARTPSIAISSTTSGCRSRKPRALSEMNLSGSVKFAVTPRGREISSRAWIPAAVTPYVGAGGGMLQYEFLQFGDFIDVDSPNSAIFTDTFRSSGWAPSAHVFGGVDVRRVQTSLSQRRRALSLVERHARSRLHRLRPDRPRRLQGNGRRSLHVLARGCNP